MKNKIYIVLYQTGSYDSIETEVLPWVIRDKGRATRLVCYLTKREERKQKASKNPRQHDLYKKKYFWAEELVIK